VLNAFSVGQVAAFFALKERNAKAQGDAAQPRCPGYRAATQRSRTLKEFHKASREK